MGSPFNNSHSGESALSEFVRAYGDVDPYASGGINAIRCFQDAFRYAGATIEGIVYGSALESGEIAQNETVLAAARELGHKLAQ